MKTLECIAIVMAIPLLVMWNMILGSLVYSKLDSDRLLMCWTHLAPTGIKFITIVLVLSLWPFIGYELWRVNYSIKVLKKEGLL